MNNAMTTITGENGNGLSTAGTPHAQPRRVWGYKATLRRVDHSLVTMIASRGFLCRSAVDPSGRAAANVRHVRVGDIIYYFFARAGRPVSELGAFRVVEPEQHDHPDYFDRAIPGTALYSTRHQGLLRLLTDDGWKAEGACSGYSPVAGEFTGWPLVRVGPSPRYQPSMFPNMTTLQRLTA